MSVDRNRYRQLSFIPEQILQSRELDWLQRMDSGVFVQDDETPVSGILQTIYRQGAIFNITATVTDNINISLTPTDPSLPMYIFVRNQWEIYPSENDDCTDSVNGTQPAAGAIMTIPFPTSIPVPIYLNWELRIRTGGLIGDDPSLTDAVTNEATASGGELILHLNTEDTSGSPLGTNQLATNTSPIVLLNFRHSNGHPPGTINFPIDNIQTQALASQTTSGLVSTTTNTPIAVSTDDPRLSTTIVGAGEVVNTSVRLPIPTGGTNADGTPTYILNSNDTGDISAAKVIINSTTQLLEDGWNWFLTQFRNLSAQFSEHIGAPLGQTSPVATHPMPTPAQVGAAPLSHVGLPLNLATSHPPVVNVSSGGFQVNQPLKFPGYLAMDPAYGVFENGTNIVSLNHDGDVYSLSANGYVAAPGGTLLSGPLGLMSTVSGVLSQHVNQTNHCNPHGLAANDIGALTTSSPMVAKAWGSFNGTGPSIITSQNIATIARTAGGSAAGDYTITFATAMNSAHYVIMISVIWFDIFSSAQVGSSLFNAANGGTDPTAGSFRVCCVRAGTFTDIPRIDIAVFSN